VLPGDRSREAGSDGRPSLCPCERGRLQELDGLVTRAASSMRARLQGLSDRALRRHAQSRGYDLVRRGFYSPVPDPAELPPDIWVRRSALEGIAFDTQTQLDFVRNELSSYLAEFDPHFETQTAVGRFFSGNYAYDSVDADLLYAMVRSLRPTRVIELGSGYSTLVLAHAVRANNEAGHQCDYQVFDPYPRDWVRDGVPGLNRCHPVKAQDIAIEQFATLGDNDILFVDTTHTVKIGSDVNHIILDVLPRLEPGVVVHFHDIFLPYEYWRYWIEGDWKWNEQYLVQAFLAMNPRYEVLVGAQALIRDHPEELKALIRDLDPRSAPSSFWIRSVKQSQ
jgi:Methyltransferase domain